VIAATNRCAGLGSDRGAIRVDLYHRVATVLIELPPLRTRRDDIELLSDEVLADLEPNHGRLVLSSSSRRMLREYRWPGNVRELRQTLTRGAALSSLVIDPHHLFQPQLRRPTPAGLPATPPRLAAGTEEKRIALGTEPPPLPRLEVMERELLVDALERHGSLRAAAEAVGMPKSTFADRVHRLGLWVGKKTPKRSAGPG
jgi:transcriptional regulator of aroF, aroG, tyrA and aromatic amino acid transport